MQSPAVPHLRLVPLPRPSSPWAACEGCAPVLTACLWGSQVKPHLTEFTFRTERQVPRLGVMLVGWGGNNGTTVTAAVLANRLGLSWMTKTGRKVSESRPPGVWRRLPGRRCSLSGPRRLQGL